LRMREARLSRTDELCICGEPGKLDWIMPDDRWASFCSISCVPASERQRYGLKVARDWRAHR
jgi:hypothetical protein